MLPLSARLFIAVILVGTGLPGLSAVYGALGGAGAEGVLGWISSHTPLVWIGSSAAVAAALLVAERPRGLSAHAYLVQLRGRLDALQSEFERAVEAALAARVSTTRADRDDSAHARQGSSPTAPPWADPTRR